jgi:hypothetical protein
MPDLFSFYFPLLVCAYLMTSLVFFKPRTGARKGKKFAKTIDKRAAKPQNLPYGHLTGLA